MVSGVPREILDTLTRLADGLSFRFIFKVNVCPVFATCVRI